MSMHQEDYKAAAEGFWAKVQAWVGENPKIAIGVGCFLAGLLFYAVFL